MIALDLHGVVALAVRTMTMNRILILQLMHHIHHDIENLRIGQLGTWSENAAAFAPCQTVTGIVRSVEEYGVFVELAPNLAGLAEYRDDVTVGARYSVYIKSITPERMKVKLALIDSVDPCPESVPGEAGDGAEMTYHLPESGHIDRWRYSPDACARVVETDFGESESVQTQSYQYEKCGTRALAE